MSGLGGGAAPLSAAGASAASGQPEDRGHYPRDRGLYQIHQPGQLSTPTHDRSHVRPV